MNQGRYAGRTMTTYGYVLPKAGRLLKLAVNVSAKAKHRLKIIDWHKANGKNQSLTCRRFGINRETLRTWLNRFQQTGIRGLEDKSHRPKKLRSTQVPLMVQDTIVNLRKTHPYYSKYKLAVLLDFKVSASTIGRVLKRKGLINPKVSRKRWRAAIHPKKRYPRDLVINKPGNLIQIDTKHLRWNNRKMYQFTAIDVLTKYRVLWIASRITSASAARFLTLCQQKFPFRLEAVQTDNGSEFHDRFDSLCKRLKLPHYFIEPHSPKQNSYVERSHLTDDKEFYQQGNMRSTVERLLPLIQSWNQIYNHLRPHQSLNYLTPMQYLQKYEDKSIPTRDYIALQT